MANNVEIDFHKIKIEKLQKEMERIWAPYAGEEGKDLFIKQAVSGYDKVFNVQSSIILFCMLGFLVFIVYQFFNSLNISL